MHIKRSDSGVSKLPGPSYRNDYDVVPQVAGVVKDIDVSSISRKYRRTMSPMSVHSI